MDHIDCRAALTSGELTPEATAHLDACPDCATLADRLRRVRTAAPALAASGVRAGLADRVLAAVSAGVPASTEPFEMDAGVPVAAPPPKARRRGVLTALSIAAVLVLLAGTLAVVVAGRNRPPLVAAAAATEQAGTLRFDLDVDSRIATMLPGVTLPRLPGLDLPRLLESSVRLHASGESVLPDRVHMRGTVSAAPVPPPGVMDAQEYEITIVGDDAWVRTPNGWMELSGAGGVLGILVLQPDNATGILRDGRDVTDRGETTLDGTPVRHYRFVAPVPGIGTTTADAWVGTGDGLLRKLTLHTSGVLEPVPSPWPGELLSGRLAVEWSSTVTLRLRDFGADVSIQAPPPGRVTGRAALPQGLQRLFFPFGIP